MKCEYSCYSIFYLALPVLTCLVFTVLVEKDGHLMRLKGLQKPLDGASVISQTLFSVFHSDELKAF